MTDHVYNHEFKHPDYTGGEWEKNYFGGHPQKDDFETLNELLNALANTSLGEGEKFIEEADSRIVKEPKEKQKKVIE